MNQQQNIFRVSAILYSNNNYIISPKQIYRKIIEDALFYQQECISVDELSKYIEENYSLVFSSQEIEMTLDDTKFQGCFLCINDKQEKKYTLTEKRRLTLKTKEDRKTLEGYIDDYFTLHNISKDKKNLIYLFLYHMFISNVNEFIRLFQFKKNGFEIESQKDLSSEDIEIINGFLNWENASKDIEIFNLASYALEYCLITNNRKNNIILDNLKNKCFYLDTNIIYRAIGINGEDRKRRTLQFLSKIKSISNTIFITQKTNEEFEQSIKLYVKRLKKSEAPSVNSQLYTEYVTYDDIYRFYHVWCLGRANTSIDLFNAYLKNEFYALCKNYDIVIDKNSPYNEKNEQENIKALAAQIKGMSEKKNFETSLYDAHNVLWIEKKRSSKESSIFSAKHFFLSSDWSLHSWDIKYHSKNSVPIVIHPSEWLSLILRYVERTNDDFKSFVSFLNIKSQEQVLSDEQINIILAGISELTSDIETQRYLLETIIEEDFSSGVNGRSNAEIKKIVKTKAEHKLQEKLEKIEQDNKSLKENVTSIEKQIKESSDKMAEKDQRISILEQHLESDKNQKANYEKDIIKLQNENEKLQLCINKRDTLKKKRRTLVWLLLIIALIVFLIICFFISSKTDNNVMGYFLLWIDGLEDTQKVVIRSILGFIVSLILFPLIKKSWSAFHDCLVLNKEIKDLVKTLKM